MLILGIDPGDKHVGLAWSHVTWRQSYPWMSDRGAVELTAEEAVDHVVDNYAYYEKPRIMVVEEFRLYANQAMSQIHSEMLTSEMIGALKYVAKKHEFEVVMQGALIKKATRSQLPARGIQPMGKGTHARDAELHLIHYMLKEKLWPGS